MPMGPQVRVELDADVIQAYVTQALLDSAIGKHLKIALEKLAETWKVKNHWDSTLEKLIKQEAERQISERVRELVKPYLEANINRLVTKDLIEELAAKAVKKLTVSTY